MTQGLLIKLDWPARELHGSTVLNSLLLAYRLLLPLRAFYVGSADQIYIPMLTWQAPWAEYPQPGLSFLGSSKTSYVAMLCFFSLSQIYSIVSMQLHYFHGTPFSYIFRAFIFQINSSSVGKYKYLSSAPR